MQRSPIDIVQYYAAAIAETPALREPARVVLAIAEAARLLADRIALGPLAGTLGLSGERNADGDAQYELDVDAHRIVLDALSRASVAWVASEESDSIEALDPAGSLAVAIDPIDGSSNIPTNLSIGTIFSIRPAKSGDGALGPFGPTGESQLGAGFVVYGPQTVLVTSLGDGVDIFTLDRRTGAFLLTGASVQVPDGVAEYAINGSNYRHWEQPVRVFIDDCLSGREGPRGIDFNMRWNASLVLEAFRILKRGGIFLYPSDARLGYEQGRLRLLYEAAPIAFLIEQAGGRASTGRTRILDIAATSLHQRVPLIFGCSSSVARLEALHAAPAMDAAASPLFTHRGLFRT